LECLISFFTSRRRLPAAPFSLEWPAVLVNLSVLDRTPSRNEVIDLVVYSSYSDNQDYELEQREISELGGQEPTP
jgi:hypothetical protein